MSETVANQILHDILRHQLRLRAFLRCLAVRSSDIEDVLQDVNVVLLEKADEFRPGTDFWAWASQIARFKALNQVRKYARERIVFDEAACERMVDIVELRLRELDERRDALEQCLKRLPESQRRLLDLRYSGGQTADRIAELIGRPAGSIRQTLYRIRAALLACIEGRLALEGGSP
jgi:RNA polymerase sigma-70 factor (ECF subfamily)